MTMASKEPWLDGDLQDRALQYAEKKKPAGSAAQLAAQTALGCMREKIRWSQLFGRKLDEIWLSVHFIWLFVFATSDK